jgi:tryptophan 2,3-dioxygenase
MAPQDSTAPGTTDDPEAESLARSTALLYHRGMPFSEASDKPLTYASYLKIDELLRLQEPLSDGPEHDEMLFIVIHQVYELWFKQIVHELRKLQEQLAAGDTTSVLASLKRVLTILKTLVAQVDVLETMTPVSFSAFRERLESASGFQSAQFREVEFLLGRKDPRVLRHHPPDSPGRRRLEELLRQPALQDSLLRYLEAAGYQVPRELLERDVSQPPAPSREVQQVLLELYRQDPLRQMVCERLVDLDEGLQEWRYRHVKMVERTIGDKSGTGGSSGAAYLRSTLFRPFFPDLWAIRAEL